MQSSKVVGMTGGRLSELVIRVLDPASLASWYSRVMGMEARQEAGAWRLTFPGPGASLVLKEAGTGARKYEASRESCYWKIGVCVPDVELARSRIMLKGVQVSAPSQFMEVGFLCHLSDPSGFSIELLQHKFQSNFVPTSPDESLALGQPAVIGQITTRSTNIEVRNIAGEILFPGEIQNVFNYPKQTQFVKLFESFFFIFRKVCNSTGIFSE